jgi:hypothetical protein
MTDRLQLVRDCYTAFVSGDRALAERVLGDDLTFSAPPDVGLDRAAYFERCWPNSGSVQPFDYVRLFEANDGPGQQPPERSAQLSRAPPPRYPARPTRSPAARPRARQAAAGSREPPTPQSQRASRRHDQ